MFDYKEFKKEMCKRGHEVHKHGDYITIEPNNNYEGYNKGFLYASDVIKGFEHELFICIILTLGYIVQDLKLYDRIKI